MKMRKPIRTVAILGRKSGMSFAEFDRYWLAVHAPLAARLPGVLRYVQRHLEGPSAEFGIDGFALIDYASTEAMEAAWASEAGQLALADVPNFLGRHEVVVITDHVIVDNEKI
jgi:uncharacterized protein (TIGR02118 family)